MLYAQRQSLLSSICCSTGLPSCKPQRQLTTAVLAALLLPIHTAAYGFSWAAWRAVAFCKLLTMPLLLIHFLLGSPRPTKVAF